MTYATIPRKTTHGWKESKCQAVSLFDHKFFQMLRYLSASSSSSWQVVGDLGSAIISSLLLLLLLTTSRDNWLRSVVLKGRVREDILSCFVDCYFFFLWDRYTEKTVYRKKGGWRFLFLFFPRRQMKRETKPLMMMSLTIHTQQNVTRITTWRERWVSFYIPQVSFFHVSLMILDGKLLFDFCYFFLPSLSLIA